MFQFTGGGYGGMGSEVKQILIYLFIWQTLFDLSPLSQTLIEANFKWWTKVILTTLHRTGFVGLSFLCYWDGRRIKAYASKSCYEY